MTAQAEALKRKTGDGAVKTQRRGAAEENDRCAAARYDASAGGGAAPTQRKRVQARAPRVEVCAAV